MKNLRLISLVMLFALTSISLFSQEEFVELYQKFNEAAQAKDWKQAAIYGEQMLPLAEETLGADNEQLGTLLNNIAKILRSAEEYDKANEAFQQAIEVRKNIHGETSEQYAASVYELAILYHITGNLEEAEPLYLNTLSIYETALGKENKKYLNVIDKLAQLYKSLDRPEDAESLYASLQEDIGEVDDPASLTKQAELKYQQGDKEEAINLYKKAVIGFENNGQTSDPNYLPAVINLSTLYKQRGESAEAQVLLEKLTKNLEDNNQNNSEAYAVAVEELGNIYENYSQYDEAEIAYQKAIGAFAKVSGENSKDYVIAESNLGQIYIKQKKYDEAETALKATMGRMEGLEMQNELAYFEIQNALARLYFQMGKYQEAEALAETIVQFQEQNPEQVDIGYAISLQNLANIYVSNQNYIKAEEFYEKSINIWQEKEGKTSQNYALAQIALGELYQAQNRIIEAQFLFEEALAIFQDENSLDYIMTITNLGDIELELENYEIAEPFYQKALVYWEENQENDIEAYAQVLYKLGSLYFLSGRFDEAESYFERSLSAYEKTFNPNNPSYIYNLGNLAGIYANRGRFSEAEQFLFKAVELGREVLGEDNADYAYSVNALAVLYKSQGRFEESEYYFKEALKIQKEDPISYTKTLNDLAALYELQGKYAEAEPLYSEAMQARKDFYGEGSAEYASIINNVAHLYRSMGRYDEAETNYLQALEIREATLGKQHPDYATTLNSLAFLYRLLAQFDKSEALYQEATQIRKDALGAKHPDYASSLDNLASLYGEMNRYDEAGPLFEEAILIRKEALGEQHPSYAASLNNLGILYEQQGELEKAKSYYEQTLDIFKNSLGTNHPDYAAVLNNLAALLYSKLDNYADAAPLYREAVSIILEQIDTNFPSLSEEEKKFFLGKNALFLDKYRLFIANVIERNKTGNNQGVGLDILQDAYNLQLATKGILLNSTAKIRKRINASGNQELKNKYNQWLNLREKIANLYTLGQAEAEKNNITALETQANNLEKEISSLSEDFKDAYDPAPVTWQNIREILAPNEAAIEIIRVNPNEENVIYTAFIITANTTDHPKAINIQNGTELESRYLTFYKNAIRFKKEDKLSYDNFWKPIQTKLTGIDKIYVSPDGVYNQINIETLKFPDKEGFVMDEQTIVLVTNTKDLVENINTEENPNNTALLLGNPTFLVDEARAENSEPIDFDNQISSWLFSARFSELEGTKKEVVDISDVMKKENWQVDLYTETDAKEEVIKSVVNPKVLHVATHGFFVPDNKKPTDQKEKNRGKEEEEIDPMLRSGIVLAYITDNFQNTATVAGEDGLLTAFEASNLQLDQTELVVVSACETGLGKVQSGEGVYGLQRALRIAGSKAVMMSLWKVDDTATQKLMVNFYREWAKGTSKREAFNIAQQKIREEYKDPYYWGAFVMIGE